MTPSSPCAPQPRRSPPPLPPPQGPPAPDTSCARRHPTSGLRVCLLPPARRFQGSVTRWHVPGLPLSVAGHCAFAGMRLLHPRLMDVGSSPVWGDREHGSCARLRAGFRGSARPSLWGAPRTVRPPRPTVTSPARVESRRVAGACGRPGPAGLFSPVAAPFCQQCVRVPFAHVLVHAEGRPSFWVRPRRRLESTAQSVSVGLRPGGRR